MLRHRGEATKGEIAAKIGVTTNTVGSICEALAERGLIRDGEKRVGLRGHPAIPLRLEATGAYAVGLKLGRRTQQSLLIDFAGNILRTRARELDLPKPEKALTILADDIAALSGALPPGSASRMTGVGLAIPYNLGSWRRELGIPDDVGDAWKQFDIGARLSALVGQPVHIGNDGTAAATAELFKGHGRHLSDFALIYFGHSVGGGLVLGGEVRSGWNGNAGDFGLIPVAPSRLASAPRPVGARTDILLNRASGAALMRHLRAAGLPIRLTSELASAIAIVPEAMEEWLEDCVDALVRPLFAISSLLDLQAIVFGGLLPASLIEAMVARLRPRMAAAAPESREPPALLVGGDGRNSAALGAAFLPFASNFGFHPLMVATPGPGPRD